MDGIRCLDGSWVDILFLMGKLERENDGFVCTCNRSNDKYRYTPSIIFFVLLRDGEDTYVQFTRHLDLN